MFPENEEDNNNCFKSLLVLSDYRQNSYNVTDRQLNCKLLWMHMKADLASCLSKFQFTSHEVKLNFKWSLNNLQWECKYYGIFTTETLDLSDTIWVLHPYQDYFCNFALNQSCMSLPNQINLFPFLKCTHPICFKEKFASLWDSHNGKTHEMKEYQTHQPNKCQSFHSPGQTGHRDLSEICFQLIYYIRAKMRIARRL